MLGIISYKDWQKLLQETYYELALESFTNYCQNIHFSGIEQQTYFLLFFDIIGSTQSINRTLSVEDIFNFLEEVLKNTANIFGENFEFKLVGDGVLILVKETVWLKKMKTITIKELYNMYEEQISLQFRLVGGFGKLSCIQFKTNQLLLKECIGRPISCLVKLSKDVKPPKPYKLMTLLDLLNCS